MFDYKKIKSIIKQNQDYQKMLVVMEKEVRSFFENFNDDYNSISNWGHNYFCKKDGGLLNFDLSSPTEHRCTICDEVYETPLLNGVWVYYYRNFASLNVWKSAILYQTTGDVIFLKYIEKMIKYYFENYLKFPRHDKNGNIFKEEDKVPWGCGRIMPQGLNEAIFFIRFFNGLQIIKEHLSHECISIVHEVVSHFNTLIAPQIDKIHNIPCWKNSALFNLGLFINNQEMVNDALFGEFGLYNQIKYGVTKDFFWFEGSIHYNFFTLEGILNSLVFAKEYDFQMNKSYKNTIEDMLYRAYQYAFDNGVLPNPNDGWPNINLKTYSYIYDMATYVFGENSNVGDLLKNIEDMPVERIELPLSRPYYYDNKISLERLTLIPEINLKKYNVILQKAYNFKTSQFAILRKNDLNVFLKYGHNGPSHAHPDKMNIEVLWNNHMLTRDLSNAGYGAALCNEWHRMSTSHSTVVVDGKNQISMRSGTTVNFRSDYIKARTTNVYQSEIDVESMLLRMNLDEVYKYLIKSMNLSPKEADNVIKGKIKLEEVLKSNPLHNIDYERTIKLLDDGFIDTFIVKSDRVVNKDYFFHSEAKMLTELPLSKVDIGYDNFGYQHIKDVHIVRMRKKKINILWQLGDKIIKSRIHLYNGARLYVMKTYDNPVNKYRTTLMIRHKGLMTKFKIDWNIERGGLNEFFLHEKRYESRHFK